MSTITVTFTREQIAAYAEASGDRNPIHLDDAFARSVGLPGLIAHGLLQMGLLARAAEDESAGRPLRALRCRFAAMVQPGDTVSFTASSPHEGRIQLEARNQEGEAILTRAVAELM